MNRLVWLKALMVLLTVTLFLACHNEEESSSPISVKFASFNVSLFRPQQGQLKSDMGNSQDPQIKMVAEIIQRVRPDILILCEFDYDSASESLGLFQRNYLGISQNGQDTINYPYRKSFSSNTGVPAGLDLDKDGSSDGPGDNFGYGQFQGQYAFAVLSKWPLLSHRARNFQNFLWKDMPNSGVPTDTLGEPYYSEEIMSSFRLSSKNHVDLPVVIRDTTVHLLISHPTPPVFDGPEDRNGRRNFDEIRLWADYISGGNQAAYLYDDHGTAGGLENEAFVLFGDLNADPYDGDSLEGAVDQLLDHPKIHRGVARGDLRPQSSGSKENATNNPRPMGDESGLKEFDTSWWGLRVDYVLPSAGLDVTGSGVFWPTSVDPLYYLVKDMASSDHLLVYVDLAFN